MPKKTPPAIPEEGSATEHALPPFANRRQSAPKRPRQDSKRIAASKLHIASAAPNAHTAESKRSMIAVAAIQRADAARLAAEKLAATSQLALASHPFLAPGASAPGAGASLTAQGDASELPHCVLDPVPGNSLPLCSSTAGTSADSFTSLHTASDTSGMRARYGTAYNSTAAPSATSGVHVKASASNVPPAVGAPAMDDGDDEVRCRGCTPSSDVPRKERARYAHDAHSPGTQAQNVWGPCTFSPFTNPFPPSRPLVITASLF